MAIHKADPCDTIARKHSSILGTRALEEVSWRIFDHIRIFWYGMVRVGLWLLKALFWLVLGTGGVSYLGYLLNHYLYHFTLPLKMSNDVHPACMDYWLIAFLTGLGLALILLGIWFVYMIGHDNTPDRKRRGDSSDD